MTNIADVLESRRDALALRRYVRERAAGRSAAEWVYLDESLGAWLIADEITATMSGREWRRVRQPSEPWCSVLGRDLTIAIDTDLQALFASLNENDPSAWRRAWIKADRASARCLADWRSRGRRLVAAVSGEPRAEDVTFAARFVDRGTGKRSLAGL